MSLTPLGPLVMTVRNQREDRRRRREMAALGLPDMGTLEALVADTKELCALYARLHPANASLWERAAELIGAHAAGSVAALDVVRRWGFVREAGRLNAPEWWDGKVILPLEFQDYSPEQYPDEAVRAAGASPARFHALARRASDLAWMGYYRVKGRLNHGGVSLLIKAVTDAALGFKPQVDRPKAGPLPIYVLGISEDEIAALQAPDVCVIGFNRGYSPMVEKLIANGRVTSLVAERGAAGEPLHLVDAGTREPFRPEAGRCFACRVDVSRDGLPVPDASGIVTTNFTLHHNSPAQQVALVRELHRVALPTRSGGRAWVAGEMFRNPHFVRVLFGPVAFVGPTLWDAWVSFVNSFATVEQLERRQAELEADGVPVRFVYVPASLVKAPTLVHRLIMPPTHVLITGG
jgi:hypothetical protein